MIFVQIAQHYYIENTCNINTRFIFQIAAKVDEIAIFGAASESFSKYVIYAIKIIKFYADLSEIVGGTT